MFHFFYPDRRSGCATASDQPFWQYSPASFCQYATCNMRPPDRYLSTFDLPGIYISPMLLTLRLNALSGGWDQTNAIAAAENSADLVSLALATCLLETSWVPNLAFCTPSTLRKLQLGYLGLELANFNPFPYSILCGPWDGLVGIDLLAAHLVDLLRTWRRKKISCYPDLGFYTLHFTR